MLAPGAVAQLAIEAREDAAAFARVRCCPECAAVMAPWRIGKLEAWLEKCTSCEKYFAEKQDLRTLEMIGKRQARERAVKTLSAKERQELATGLAQSVVTDAPAPDLSGLQLALMYVGIPSVTRVDGNKQPYATWGMALAVLLVFLLGQADEEGFGAFALAYDPVSGEAWRAFTATFAHFSWLHVIGNIGFLIAFGDGVEQRMPRWMLVLSFVGAAPLFTLLEAGITGTDAVIGGASGAVAMVMGACVVLQPKAKVWFLLLKRFPLHVPMLAFGAFELVYQGVMAMIGVGSVAWWAHLGGLVFGLAGGLVIRARHASSLGPSSARLAG